VASAFSHGVAALGISACFYKPEVPKRVWVIGVVSSILPDIDVVGFHFGIRYEDFWGHRGFTHSLVFAALLAGAIVVLAFRSGAPGIGPMKLWLFLFLVTASHGFLDAMTNGGLGVAFFSPFDTHRYFLPWRPILVSPISATRFFTKRGIAILQSELLWIWLPALVLGTTAFALRATMRENRVP
jgi:inner membrane protein